MYLTQTWEKKPLKPDLLQLMKTRRSIRKYRENPIPLEKIYGILEAGRWAPSGGNTQPWVYIVITEKELKEKIRAKAENIEKKFHATANDTFKRWLEKHQITPEKRFLTEAPVLVIVAGWTKAPYWLESTWISLAYVLLSAESQRVGTLTYTPAKMDFLNKLLSLPDDYQPVAILPMGEPREEPAFQTRSRKPLEQMVCLNGYCENTD
jgi:nitroreductase